MTEKHSFVSYTMKVDSLLIVLALTALPLEFAAHASIPTLKQKVTEIRIPQPSKSTVGFLTLPEGYFNKDTKIKIYNFVGDGERNFKVELRFHEIHWNFQIVICKSNQYELAPFDALLIPPSKHKKGAGSTINKFCKTICPVISPVVTNDGPIFLEIISEPTQMEPLPKREQLASVNRENEPFYNITYYMFYENDTLFNDSILKTQLPCNLNGVPILNKINQSFYEFECSCRFSTRGSICQWGLECPHNESRALCSNHGTCRVIENLFGCTCEADYYEPNCIHYSLFPLEEDSTICKSNNCTTNFCQILPDGKVKCLCGPGSKLENENCVSESADVILEYSLKRNISNDQIKIEIKRLLRCSSERTTLHIEPLVDSLLQRVTLKELPIGTAKIINTDSFLTSLLKKPCSHEKSPIIGLSTIQSLNLTAIRSFKYKYTWKENAKELEVCCYTNKTDVAVTFLRDGYTINSRPVKSENGMDSWRQGSYSILYNNGYRHGFCLLIVSPLDEDFGLYHCEVKGINIYEKRSLLTHRMHTEMDIELKADNITLEREQNANLTCKVNAISSYSSTFKFDLELLPKKAYGYYQTLKQSKSTLVIKVFNITENLDVRCSSTQILIKKRPCGTESEDSHYDEQKEGRYFETSLSITILKNSYRCEPEHNLGMAWPLSKVDEVQVSPCPRGYEGTCRRSCSMEGRETSPLAAWRTLDCSDCTKKPLVLFFRRLEIYKRGIHSYFPHPERMFKELLQHLTNSTFLPGEAGGILKQIRPFLVMNDFKPSFKDFWTLIDLLLECEKPLIVEDLVSFNSLLEAQPWRPTDISCIHKFIEKKNILVHYQRPYGDTFLSMNFPIASLYPESWKHSKSKCLGIDPNKKALLQVRGIGKSVSSIVSVLFWKPGSLVPYWKETVKGGCLDESSFSQVTSPFVMTSLFTESTLNSGLSDEMETSLTLDSCSSQIDLLLDKDRYTLRCSQYIPGLGWNSENCFFTRNSNGSCSCTCKGTGGWLGFICSDNHKVEEQSQAWDVNIVVALSCSISLLFLLSTIVLLACNRRDLPSTALPKVVDANANLILNCVFLHASISDSKQLPNTALFILVACCFFISLCMLGSHQVSFVPRLNKKDSFLISSRMTYSSFLVFIVSTVLVAMLAFSLWMVVKVDSLVMICFWLPHSYPQSAKIIALCFIVFSFALDLSISIFIFVKLKNAQIKHYSSETTIKSMLVQCRNFFALAILEFLLMVTSIFREYPTGKYFFAVSNILLSLSLLYIYGLIPRLENKRAYLLRNDRNGKSSTSLCCRFKFLAFLFLREGAPVSHHASNCEVNGIPERVQIRNLRDPTLEDDADHLQSPQRRELVVSNHNEVESINTRMDGRASYPPIIRPTIENYFIRDSVVTSSPRYLPMNAVKEDVYYQNCPSARITKLTSPVHFRRTIDTHPTVTYEHRPCQTLVLNNAHKHQSMDAIKYEDSNVRNSSPNFSREINRLVNSTCHTGNSLESSTLPNSLNSSPHPDRSKGGLFKRFSSKMSLLTIRSKGSKRNFVFERMSQSYNGLVEDATTSESDSKLREPIVDSFCRMPDRYSNRRRRQHSF